MDPEYGAAQPLMDYVRRGYNTARRALSYIPDNLPGMKKSQPKDTSWHDEMVKNANRSFQRQAATSAAKKTKRTPMRSAARKRR